MTCAEPAPAGTPGSAAGVADVIEMTVADVRVQVRRTAPFTATEHARGAGLAELVSDVLARDRRDTLTSVPGLSPVGSLVIDHGGPGRLEARVAGRLIGEANVVPADAGDDPDPGDDPGDDPGARIVKLRVDPAWRRQGIGSRLLIEAARVAQAQGALEIVLFTRADNRAVLPMVLSAGLRGRIKLSGDVLTVRMSVRELTPSRAEV